MSKNSLLLTRPNHDQTTNYLCVWSEDIIAAAKKKNWIVLDLKGSKATQSNFNSYLNSREPELLVINGHGNTKTICGQNNEVLLSVNQKLKGLKNKIIYARSCDSAVELGDFLLKNGFLTFIGYRRKFVFGFQREKISRPKEDQIAKLFLEPSNLVAQTLIKGHS